MLAAHEVPKDKGLKEATNPEERSHEKQQPDQRKSLEYWLTRATDPYLGESNRPQYVKGFCEQVNEELEGPQIACKLLAHKIQSPYEVEALHGLMVLDSCVKNCGVRFHNEIGKFRFLNEIIKILSPKYMGSQTNDKVKQRAIELLYSWKQTMKHLQKIQQAYGMLREQGIITQDPVYMDEILEVQPVAVEKPRLASFEDEEKSKLLAALLKSKNPDDLQTANRLIKSMVKAEDQKIEKLSKRTEDLQSASNNAQLLSEMVGQFDFSLSSAQDVEIMKELADSLHKFRPILFRYAGEAAEGQEETLGVVLGINDEVGRAVDDYKAKVEPYVSAILAQSKTSQSQQLSVQKNSALLSSLLNFDASPSRSAPGGGLVTPDMPSCNSELSVTSDDVGILGASGTPLISRRKQQEMQQTNNGNNSAVNDLNELLGGSNTTSHLFSHNKAVPPNSLAETLRLGSNGEKGQNSIKSPVAGTAAKIQEEEKKQKKGLFDLDELSQSLIKQNLPTNTVTVSDVQKITEQRQKVPMRDLPRQTTAPPSMSPLDPYAYPPFTALQPAGVGQQSSADSVAEAESASTSGPSSPNRGTETEAANRDSAQVLVDLEVANEAEEAAVSSAEAPSLDDVIVAVEEIKPGVLPPVSVLDREQIKVVLHYASNRPKPGVLTTVVSVTTTNSHPLTNVRFEASTERKKDVNVKLQRPSADRLPGFNPIFPQSAITQIMLLSMANSNECATVSLDYTLNYCVGQNGKSSHSVSGSFDVDYRPEE